MCLDNNKIHKNKLNFITDTSSLTVKLNQLFNNRLLVNVISCATQILTLDSMMPIAQHDINYSLKTFLKHNLNNLTQIRNVKLDADNNTLVVAQSIASVKQLNKAKFDLCVLGNNSLGTFLYSHANLNRTPCQVFTLPYFKFADNNYADVLARYSIFNIEQLDILVIEVFLPILWQKLNFI